MKIRMIRNHAAVEEVTYANQRIYGQDIQDRAYVRKGSRDGQWEIFLESEWEEVPKEQWVDVTSKCRFGGLGDLFIGDKCIQGLADLSNHGYRLSTVHLLEYESDNPIRRTAFIIEKKVP